MAGEDRRGGEGGRKDFHCTVCGKPGVYLTDDGLMCRTHALVGTEQADGSEEPQD